MPRVRVGSWNVERAGFAFGRASKVAQFILDWFQVTVAPTTQYTSSLNSNSFSPYYTVNSFSNSSLGTPLLDSRFQREEVLMPTFSMGGPINDFPSKEYHNKPPKGVLQAHGKSPQLVELHSFQPALTTAIGERPKVSAMARFEAATRAIVTNLWHDRVTLLPVQQRLLPYLDGSRTRADLAVLMAGTLSPAEIDEHLRFLAYAALLVEE